LKSSNAEAITEASGPSTHPCASPLKMRCTGDHWPTVMNRTEAISFFVQLA
jgi:hypothetical protein